MVKIDRLASEWMLAQREFDTAVGVDWAGFCERTQVLSSQVAAGSSWRNKTWNIFDVLGRPRLEDAHSRMIAWLLDPGKPHGLGDGFLRGFFKRVFGTTPPAGTSECLVTTKKRIKSGEVDIEVAGPRWWLIVENKIDWEEDDGQTEKYAMYYRQFSKLNSNLFLVLLSPQGTHPKSPAFRAMSYRDLREVLEDVLELLRPAEEAEQLMRHFLQHILLEVEN